MLPVPPPLVRAEASVSVAGYRFFVFAGATAVRASSTQVEYLPLQIVPRVTLTLEPREMLVPPARRGRRLSWSRAFTTTVLRRRNRKWGWMLLRAGPA